MVPEVPKKSLKTFFRFLDWFLRFAHISYGVAELELEGTGGLDDEDWRPQTVSHAGVSAATTATLPQVHALLWEKKSDLRDSGCTIRQKFNLIEIWYLTFEHLSIWTFEHLKIWTFEHLNIWTFEHWNIGTFNIQSASCEINCVHWYCLSDLELHL